jgi:chemotaxis-related protein WspB
MRSLRLAKIVSNQGLNQSDRADGTILNLGMLDLILLLVMFMLWLLLSIEGERYALESSNVLEILPWVKLQPLPQAPDLITGLLSYHDRSIPVIDLSQILYQRSCQLRICTRIILVQRSVQNGIVEGRESPQVIGLLAEQLARTRRISNTDQTQITPPAVKTPFISAVLSDPQGVIQCLEMDALWAAIQPAISAPAPL